jgi:DNA-binding NarL/FixJ family response regulator
MPETTRIGIVDADKDIRMGRKLLLTSISDVEVVFDSDGASSDIESIQRSLIDVLLIDQKLASGPGVGFYSSLRELTGIKDAPSAVITTSYIQPALLLEALEAGAFDVVAVEQGAKALIDTVTSVTKGSNAYALSELKNLLTTQSQIRVVDLNLVSLIDQLPEKLASNLRRLKSVWRKEDVSKLEQYKLSALDDLVARLPVANATELVLALNKSGLLDE